MKKILCNGCSFVAGDALVWDKYLKENNLDGLEDWIKLKIKIKNENASKFEEFHFNQYRMLYRKKYNLTAMIANKLNTSSVDLSEDGNSNDAITLTTILYLLNVLPENRSKYHVIIGWTALPRRLKYSDLYKKFVSLNNNFLVHLNGDNKMYSELKEYTTTMMSLYHEDHYLNYITNIMLLENFLKSNNCTYTFYRSLGTLTEGNLRLWPLANIESMTQDLKKIISNDNNWLSFDKGKLSIDSESFGEKYILGEKNKTNRLADNNPHPTYFMTEFLAEQLVNFINYRNQL